ncbi:MAG TPA: hypothetical protein VFD58_06910 [Blastocatellia bacterium]|nr:hypothetical protein [Blastocatellia bacterium]
MKPTTSAAMRVAALLVTLVCIASAQQSGAGKRTPSLTMDNLGTYRQEDQASRGSQTGVTHSDALSLLPPSDIVAVIDVRQALDLLLPKMNSIAPGELLKMKRALDEFMNKTGIDPTKITTATIGVDLSGGSTGKGSGAIIVQGIEPDFQKIAAFLRSEKITFRTLTHQGKTLLAGTIDGKKLSGMSLPTSSSTKAEEVALAPLDRGMVFGDVTSVKSVLDAQARARAGFPNALLVETLGQTSSAGLIRFSAAVPENFRQTLRKQGELALPFAAVRTVAGSLSIDQADGASMTFDFKLRTSTADEAARLDAALKGFVALGKSSIASSQDAQAQLLGQFLDQVQITTEGNNVGLSLYLPKSLMDQFKERFSSSKRNIAVNSRR